MRILVCKLRHHGDVLLTSPFLYALREAFPLAEIDVFLAKETHPMLEGHPCVSRFFFKEDGFLFRKHAYSHAFNLTEGDRGAIACFLSGAKIKVGVDPGRSGFWGKRRIYTHLVEHCPHEKHTVEKNLDALRVLGISPSKSCREVTFHIPEAVLSKIKDRVGTGYILVHPVSRWMFKALPIEVMAECIEALQKKGQKIILSSGPGKEECAYISALQSRLTSPVESLAGETTLKELGALIAHASMLICPDSVPFHMASALKKPVVTFFGPSSEKNWGPWRNEHAIIVKKDLPCRPCFRAGCANTGIADCLQAITSDELLGPIEALLKNVDACVHI